MPATVGIDVIAARRGAIDQRPGRGSCRCGADGGVGRAIEPRCAWLSAPDRRHATSEHDRERGPSHRRILRHRCPAFRTGAGSRARRSVADLHEFCAPGAARALLNGGLYEAIALRSGRVAGCGAGGSAGLQRCVARPPMPARVGSASVASGISAQFRGILQSGGIPGPDTLDANGFFNEHFGAAARDRVHRSAVHDSRPVGRKGLGARPASGGAPDRGRHQRRPRELSEATVEPGDRRRSLGLDGRGWPAREGQVRNARHADRCASIRPIISRSSSSTIRSRSMRTSRRKPIARTSTIVNALTPRGRPTSSPGLQQASICRSPHSRPIARTRDLPLRWARDDRQFRIRRRSSRWPIATSPTASASRRSASASRSTSR